MPSTRKNKSKPKSRIALIKFFIILLPLWFSALYYAGPYHEQVRYYLAAILFLIFLAVTIQLLLPELPEKPLLIGLFLVLCLIEATAWQYPELVQHLSLRLDDHTILGAHHSLNKIPYYGVGTFIGYFILRSCR